MKLKKNSEACARIVISLDEKLTSAPVDFIPPLTEPLPSYMADRNNDTVGRSSLTGFQVFRNQATSDL